MTDRGEGRIRPLHGHVRARESRGREQLDLFGRGATVHALPTRLSPFDRARLLDDRDSPAAGEAYLESIRCGDSVADAYCNLAVLSDRTGDSERAVELLTHALENDPGHPESHFNLGNLYLEKGWHRPAEVEYRLVIHFEPELSGALYNLALCCVLQKKVQEGIHWLQLYMEQVTPAEAAKAETLLRHLR